MGNLHDMILVNPELFARFDILLNSIQFRFDRISPTQTHTWLSLPEPTGECCQLGGLTLPRPAWGISAYAGHSSMY